MIDNLDSSDARSVARRRLSPGPDLGPFSKMPSKIFGSGTAAMLGTSASLCYLALCEQANRNSSNTFKASDRAIASETGLSPRTVCDARKRLIEKGLIQCARQHGQSFTYTLLKQSLNWVPLADRPRPKRRPRAIFTTRVGPEQVQITAGTQANSAGLHPQRLLDGRQSLLNR